MKDIHNDLQVRWSNKDTIQTLKYAKMGFSILSGIFHLPAAQNRVVLKALMDSGAVLPASTGLIKFQGYMSKLTLALTCTIFYHEFANKIGFKKETTVKWTSYGFLALSALTMVTFYKLFVSKSDQTKISLKLSYYVTPFIKIICGVLLLYQHIHLKKNDPIVYIQPIGQISKIIELWFIEDLLCEDPTATTFNVAHLVEMGLDVVPNIIHTFHAIWGIEEA
ncbi:MAG: hypothetical protein AAGA77_22230 [Bacteroidota bacterium]